MTTTPIKALASEASSEPTQERWVYVFHKSGGYDCMTDAFEVRDEIGADLFTVDLVDFGQDRCALPNAKTLEAAERVARLAAAAPVMLEALRVIAKVSGPGQVIGITEAIDALCNCWNLTQVAIKTATTTEG